MDLASQEAQLQALKVHINEAKVKKRRKVEQADPNKKFVTVANVTRTRMDMEPTIVVASSWSGCISNLTAVRLELAALLFVEGGW